MKSAAGVYVYRIQCGQVHTLMIVRNESDKDKEALTEIPMYDPKPNP